ncbi:MAG: hypothetical protein WKF41_08140 [Gaiellaceae bacterium]
MTRRRFVTLAGVGVASRRPSLGTRELDGAARLPYQPSTFPTPPFAEFTSGHSTLGAAGRDPLRPGRPRRPRYGQACRRGCWDRAQGFVTGDA